MLTGASDAVLKTNVNRGGRMRVVATLSAEVSLCKNDDFILSVPTPSTSSSIISLRLRHRFHLSGVLLVS